MDETEILERDPQTGRFYPYQDYNDRIGQYREYLVATRAKSTAKTYIHGARKFEVFLEEKELNIESAHSGLLGDFVLWLSQENLEPSTINTHVIAVKKYLIWLRDHGEKIPELNDPDLPRVIRKRGYTPDSMEVVKYLYASKEARQPIKTILLLLPYCGMRIGEICSLPIKAIDIGEDNEGRRYFIFRFVGKGGDEKEIPVLPPGDKILIDYIENWRKKIDRLSPWLFPGRGETPISPDAVRNHLNDIRNIIESPKLTPHALRRSYATNLYKHGIDIVTISRMMGHLDIKTTFKHYVNPSLKDTLTKLSELDGD